MIHIHINLAFLNEYVSLLTELSCFYCQHAECLIGKNEETIYALTFPHLTWHAPLSAIPASIEVTEGAFDESACGDRRNGHLLAESDPQFFQRDLRKGTVHSPEDSRCIFHVRQKVHVGRRS